ncbi:CPBP family intramembrane glutamic endopeptidase [Parasphingorhabdus sp.]|uniref:CPBP family intramembrane glutamic endopeptidase n=1 Tax=Parasphingorhabdus sp. TaxID=2709688 RepID=UPI003264F5F7
MHTFESLLIWNGIFLVASMIARYFAGDNFNVKWLAAAFTLFNINVALVLNIFGLNGLIDSFIGVEDLQFNWAGKVFALAASLIILASGVIDRGKSGVTFKQSEQAHWGWGLFILLLILSIIVASFIPDEAHTSEAITYQLTMPSIEEELFYRGIFLYCLVRAFGDGRSILWSNFGIAALISTLMFTIIHGIYWSDQGLFVSIEAILFAGIFGFLLTWLRLNTGSIIAPILLHSVVNTVWRLL